LNYVKLSTSFTHPERWRDRPNETSATAQCQAGANSGRTIDHGDLEDEAGAGIPNSLSAQERYFFGLMTEVVYERRIDDE
jgi:hypothetical protein